jgi:hypothetical protein
VVLSWYMSLSPPPSCHFGILLQCLHMNCSFSSSIEMIFSSCW